MVKNSRWVSGGWTSHHTQMFRQNRRDEIRSSTWRGLRPDDGASGWVTCGGGQSGLRTHRAVLVRIPPRSRQTRNGAGIHRLEELLDLYVPG